MVTLAILRNPIEYLFSAYRMWPPRSDDGDRLTTEFPQWLARAHGLQARALPLPSHHCRSLIHRDRVAITMVTLPLQAAQLSPGCSHASRSNGMWSECRCADALPAARRCLRQMDVVGFTCCLPRVLDEIERRLGLPTDQVRRWVPWQPVCLHQ